MKLAVALACLPAAAAFVAPAAPAAGVQMSETKADLEALAKQCNPAVGFWDPLGCLNFDFWKLGQEAYAHRQQLPYFYELLTGPAQTILDRWFKKL